MEELIEQNTLIAKWLGWNILQSESCTFEYIKNEYFYGGIEFLRFDSDSNLQWICLEKIMKEYEYESIVQVYSFLEYIQTIDKNVEINIKNKSDIFNAILDYIRLVVNEELLELKRF